MTHPTMREFTTKKARPSTFHLIYFPLLPLLFAFLIESLMFFSLRTYRLSRFPGILQNDYKCKFRFMFVILIYC